MRAIILAFCLICVSVCCVPLFGEVTSGYIQITGDIPVGYFNLSGTAFNVEGGFGSGNWAPTYCSYGCSEGSVLSVNGIEIGNDFGGGGSATINGTNFSHVNWGDLNAYPASTFMVFGPGITLNHGAGTYFGTFDFFGSLCGTIDYTGQCAVDLGLSGSGRVAVDIRSFTDNGQTILYFQQATYTFLTPEPGTILLIGSGLVAVAGALRRKMNL